MPESRSRLRELVRHRARGLCEYCRSPERFAPSTFSVEHIVPRCRHGKDGLENLAFSCQGCNGHKYIKIDAPDPVSGDIVSLFHPRRHHWNEHFAWSTDLTLILGRTPTGRATVAALHLNRESLIGLRRLLLAMGEHPSTPAM